MRRARWAVFISGRGSNLSALLEMRGSMEMAYVVSSRKSAPGLARARRAGVKTLILPKRLDWHELTSTLERAGVEFIFLAGFMRIVPPEFVDQWQGRILNLHPSLLPLYPGLESIERAYREQSAIGLSVHEVTRDVDQGRIVYQRKVIDGERVRQFSLSASAFLVHVNEHRLVREAVSRWKTNLMW